MKCIHCGYMWKSKSKMIFITCPNCQKKTKAKFVERIERSNR